jgi:hypothetical protein
VLAVSEGRVEEIQRIRLPQGSKSWYLHVGEADREYRCELGSLDASGRFTPVIGSNGSATPSENLQPVEASVSAAAGSGLSPAVGPVPDQDVGVSAPAPKAGSEADRLMAMSTLPGLDSAEALRALEERLKGALASELLHSEVHVSESGKKAEAIGARANYWLRADADVIIYGATVPGSRVTLRGLDLPVDGDGHFVARFALPDGELDFPIEGTSPDRQFSQRAQIDVQRQSELEKSARRISG